ncbi:MAG: HD-GYP domain-containing protein [Spirochaetaceae bacterium]|jgi:hypothetical protein|nr:HD-GYP domain-containing protein [Spirochaetaceae bacterium]
MTKIPAESLKEGQKFSKAVFIDKDSVFVPENTAIRKKDLRLIESLGIENVFTDGKPVLEGGKSVKDGADIAGDAGIAGGADITDGVAETPPLSVSASEILSEVAVLVRQLGLVFSAIADKRQVNIRLLWSATDSLLQLVKACPEKLLYLVVSEDPEGGEMAKKGVYTAIISTIIGGKMNFTAKKNQELAVGALLHDAGMLRLPEDVLKKRGTLSASEVDIIKSHTLFSFNIIKKELLYPDSVCQIALQHHEHWNGTGYPRRLSGNYINERALIVSVADAFIAMLNKNVYRDSMTGYQAMKTLMAEAGACFSPDILQMFVQIMGIYPIGSGVRLNNGSTARVTSINPAVPLRPVVEIVAGKNGVAERAKTVDLLTNKDLFITGDVDIKDFGKRL